MLNSIYDNICWFTAYIFAVRDPNGLFPSIAYARLGGSTQFQCYSDEPVDWYYKQQEGQEKQPLPPLAETSLQNKMYILRINNVQEYHFGSYICYYGKYKYESNMKKRAPKDYFYSESLLVPGKLRNSEIYGLHW